MKQLLGVTILIVALIILNTPAAISESMRTALAEAAEPSDTGALENGKALCEAPTRLQLGPGATSATGAAIRDSRRADVGVLLTMPGLNQEAVGNVRRSNRRQTGSVEIAMVANARAGTVALFDVASRTVLGAIDVNPGRMKREGPGTPNYAQDTDVSPDGRTLYVSRGYLGDVAAFDIVSGRLLWNRPLNTGRADHMTLTPDGRSLFVSALTENRVYRVATASGEITGHLVTGIYPHDNKVSRDGRRLYNTSIGPISSLPRQASAPQLKETPGYPFQMTIADVSSLRIRQRIRLDNAFRPWQFTRDEKSVYTQLSNEHAVVAYSLAARKVVRRLDLPVKPGVTVADWDFEAPHHGLALTPDGKTLCLAARASDYVALVRAPELKLIATIPVGDAPGWAETAENGRLCLIANTRSDELSVISIPKRKEIARLPMSGGPKHITVSRIPVSVIAAFKARH